MAVTVNLNIDILDNYIENKCGGKEYFLGCWSPNGLNFTSNSVPDHIQVENKKNWFVLRNGADKTNGLIHKSNEVDEPQVVVFRGYLVDENIHSYSSSSRVRHYWSNNLLKRHNGIFSAIIIGENGHQLDIVTDIFGINPLFYRKVGDLIFFSSAPGLLAMSGDSPDTAAWVLNAVLGYIPGNSSLTKEIKMADPASVTRFTIEQMESIQWHKDEEFPVGDKDVNELALKLSHQYLESAINKCIKMQHGKTVIPLSGGHDSRRLFAHVVDSATAFETCTVRMTTATGEDLDLFYGIKIARDYNIDHVAIELPNKVEWKDNDIQRIYSMDGQSLVHTWSVSMFKHYSNEEISLYDGMGGDVFGFHGLIVNDDKDIKLPIAMPKQLKRDAFPSDEHISQQIIALKNSHAPGPNHGMLVFLEGQSRKSTCLWAQQQTRPGQLTIYPYLELDYVELMLQYSYKEKTYERNQLNIMKKYWPKLASYPSSRNIPEGAKKINHIYRVNNRYAMKQLLKESYSRNSSEFHFKSFLTWSARILLYCSQFSNYIEVKTKWWSRPITELVFWWQSRPFIVEVQNEEKE